MNSGDDPEEQDKAAIEAWCAAIVFGLHVWCTSVNGEPIDQAERAAIGMGFSTRRTKVDGRPLTVTRDYRTDRINFEVSNGIVERAYVG